MATLTVRNLSEETRLSLKKRAALNNRSMEAEARAILENAVDVRKDFIQDWLDATKNLRGEPLTVPERSSAREVELG